MGRDRVTPPADFPASLRRLREAAGISMYELARRAGISPDMVSRMERGQRGPTLETARKLARALGEESLACWD